MVREATPRLFCGECAQQQISQAIPKNNQAVSRSEAEYRHVATLDRHLAWFDFFLGIDDDQGP